MSEPRHLEEFRNMDRSIEEWQLILSDLRRVYGPGTRLRVESGSNGNVLVVHSERPS